MSSTDDITESMPAPRSRRTIQEELSQLEEIHTMEEFDAKFSEVEKRVGRSEAFCDVVTWKIDDAGIFRFENYTSIYSLLMSHRYPGLPSEKSSIHGALKRGRALVELTGMAYRDHMLRYLEELGPKAGRGVFKEGKPQGFALEDFALHRTKLSLLYDLVTFGDDVNEPNWRIFFDSSFGEYKAYVLGKLKKNPGGSFSKGDTGDPSHRPGGKSEGSKESNIGNLDPFAAAFPEKHSEDAGLLYPRAGKPIPMKLPRLGLDRLPSGTLPPIAWLFLNSPASEPSANDSATTASGE